MSDYRFPRQIRQIIRDALPQDTSLHGSIPVLKDTYFPSGHAKALRPDSMLVEGIRGAGKSFWWAALQSREHRLLLGKILPDTGITEGTVVSRGFGEKSSPDDYPGRDVLAQLLGLFDARDIWRTIVLVHLTKERNSDCALADLEAWEARINWVLGKPEQVERLIFDIDNELNRSRSYHLILFDALDRTATDWQSMYKLVRGLLQVLLEFRSYQRIRPKVFVRPDHLEGASAAIFPDSSKVLSGKVELSWPRNDLYGLFFQHLANEKKGGDFFRKESLKGFNIGWTRYGQVFLPLSLRNEEKTQRAVFQAITGPWMGRDRRRGFPYTWLPNHLGDALRNVSPRTFLAALRHAAVNTSGPADGYALHYESIKRGVQEASRIRVREMQEDYPWVEILMDPLKGLTVPCSFDEIAKRWNDNKVVERLRKGIKDAEVRLPPAHLDSDVSGIRKDLEMLGLFQRMADGRVNLPDVYRVGYGIGRRGGVKVVAAR